MTMTERDFTLIKDHTALSTVPGLPGISLHLVTCEQDWWYQTPEDLKPLGITDPYWAFAWPGGLALAQFLLKNPAWVVNKRIFDLGAGSGVTSIAALNSGAAHVTINDTDSWALKAASLNLAANGFNTPHDRIALTSDNLIGQDLSTNLLLLGDVTYSHELVAKLIPWIERLSAKGTDILLADPGRGYLPKIGQVIGEEIVPLEIDDGRSKLTAVNIMHLSCTQHP